MVKKSIKTTIKTIDKNKEYDIRQDCPRCKGTGAFEGIRGDSSGNPISFIENPCAVCDGKGYVVLGYVVKVN